MDYVSALVPPAVMAVAFTALIITLIKNQGGPNKFKEDAIVDAAIARAESARQAGGAAGASGAAAERPAEAVERPALSE